MNVMPIYFLLRCPRLTSHTTFFSHVIAADFMAIERCHLYKVPGPRLKDVCSYFSQFERFIPDISCQDVVAQLTSLSLNVEMRLESLVVDLPGCPELDVRLEEKIFHQRTELTGLGDCTVQSEGRQTSSSSSVSAAWRGSPPPSSHLGNVLY